MAYLINVVKKYKYESLTRQDLPEGRRYVTPDGKPLPSVTTILNATKDKKHLDSWAARVGTEEADRIKNEAATRGTHMHGCIERVIKHRPLEVPTTWLMMQGYQMGFILMQKYFPQLQQVWGNEVSLFYPDKYAGSTDLVGVYRDKSSIVDFKQANQMKKRGWIEDYFHQLAAYALAHDARHGTQIEQGVVLMCTPSGETEEFVSVGREWDQYKAAWLRRVEQYYAAPELPLQS